MYFFIPLIISALGLVVVLGMVIRKFPELARLDVTTLPHEKEARRKKEILAHRINEQGEHVKAVWKGKLQPLKKVWAGIQLRFRKYVGRIERLWYHEHVTDLAGGEPALLTQQQKEDKFYTLIQDGEEQLRLGNYDQAEGFFIAAIKLNQNSVPAYRGLGDTYVAKGSLEEAQETFKFLLHLTPHDDSLMVKLGTIAENRGDIEEAIQYYQSAVIENDALAPRFFHLGELFLKIQQPQIAKEALLSAVEIEPKNPKYLDLLTEVAILCRDKHIAFKTYQELRGVNPENQKLELFKSKIHHL
jgi:tetratricopeptide (TPR) repeat protein